MLNVRNKAIVSCLAAWQNTTIKSRASSLAGENLATHNINKGLIIIKRVNNLYEKIYDLDNLRLAHKRARKDKSKYLSVQMVDRDPDKYLLDIQRMLKDKTYVIQSSDYTKMIINDRGKDRVLHKLDYYPHRIIQWAIMLQIEPTLLQTFTTHTCASIPKRGIHYAYNLMQRYLKDVEGTRYCFKMDIHHFYPSINHEILKELLRRKFKDPDLLWLLDSIIDSHAGDGIPIGSYLSQYLGNYYLAYFDHWLKEELHLKYVVRYMDDVVILGPDAAFLHEKARQIIEYLKNELALDVKGNWQVFPTRVRGVDFVGYRFFGDYTLLRKGTCKRFKRAMRDIRKRGYVDEHSDHQICSYQGWLKWGDCYRLANKYISPVLPLQETYTKGVTSV